MTECTIILFSKKDQVALTKNIKLPIQPFIKLRLVISLKRGLLTLIVQEITWKDSNPEILFLSCATEHPGSGRDDGTMVTIPFGEMPSGMYQEFVPDFNKIDDGDDYFTLPRS